MRLLLQILSICMMPSIALACCSGPTNNWIFMLHHNNPNQHAFDVEIIEAYQTFMSPFKSKGVVTARYFGAIPDTVIINSGGNTSAGGQYLEVGKIYFINGYLDQNGEYGAFVCDYYSTEIYGNVSNRDDWKFKKLGYRQALLDLLTTKEQWYTGHKVYMNGEDTLAFGTYLYGKPVGQWDYYQMYGGMSYLFSSSKYNEQGLLHGPSIYYKSKYESVRREDWYEDGVLVSSTYYDSSNRLKANYTKEVDDDLEVRIDWDTLGQVSRSSSLIQLDAQGGSGILAVMQVLHGSYAYNTDKDHSKGQYYMGKKVGKWVENGVETNYDDYKPMGGDTLVFYNHQFKYVGRVVDGVKEGLWTVWNNNTQSLYAEYYFSNGILDGPFLYENYNGTYVNGQLQGPYYSIAANGDTLQFEFYKDGKLHGPATYIYPNGQLRRTTHYRDGLIDGEDIFYTNVQNGPSQIQIMHTYKAGCRHGYAEEYNRHGQLIEKGYYHNNMKIGEWIRSNYKNGNHAYKTVQYVIVKEKNSNRLSAMTTDEFKNAKQYGYEMVKVER